MFISELCTGCTYPDVVPLTLGSLSSDEVEATGTPDIHPLSLLDTPMAAVNGL